MKPQFTIRDWFWLVPLFAVFLQGAGNQFHIARLREKLAMIEGQLNAVSHNAEWVADTTNKLIQKFDQTLEDHDVIIRQLQGNVWDLTKRSYGIETGELADVAGKSFVPWTPPFPGAEAPPIP